MSESTLLINARGPEYRSALYEGGQLCDLHIERQDERGLAGNIYRGRVIRVLPGMQAAFIDIGLERAAFLHVSDLVEAALPAGPPPRRALEAAGEEATDDESEEPPPRTASIQDVLAVGQERTVQVAKEPLGSKGARVTTYVSLPGRHLVYTPSVSHVGISRRIADEVERERLRQILEELREDDAGYIIRTAAEGQPASEIGSDIDFLNRLWRETKRRGSRVRAPSLLHADLDLILRSVRDLLTGDVRRCLVDDARQYDRIREFVSTFMPRYLDRIELYEGTEPIFDHFGAEAEIERALARKVWLKSGGYLVIDQAEALTAIDVNTGRYVGRHNLEDTITRINLEAVKEIAIQLRLRNLGGIIVIDFIDMEKEANRLQVWRALHDAVQSDRARCNVGQISDLCLVEMTRKRTRESLNRILTDACFYCEGRGYLKSPMTLSHEVLRQIRRLCHATSARRVVVSCHPSVAELMAQGAPEEVEALERQIGVTVQVNADPNFHLEQYTVDEVSPETKDEEAEDQGSVERAVPTPITGRGA